MQIGAWYKFVNQKDENVNPPVKTTVAEPRKLFLQVEKLTSQKPLENFSEEILGREAKAHLRTLT